MRRQSPIPLLNGGTLDGNWTSQTWKEGWLDGISTKVIKHFGPETQQWILDLFIILCETSCKIPKNWREAKVVAILKPCKDPNNKKLNLLCVLYKLYEHLIMGRVSEDLEEKSIKRMAMRTKNHMLCLCGPYRSILFNKSYVTPT